MSKKDIIICRCEDITLEDVHKCLEQGYTTFEELKRILRVGMGPCQGQTCSVLIQREIAIFHKKKAVTFGGSKNNLVGIPITTYAKN